MCRIVVLGHGRGQPAVDHTDLQIRCAFKVSSASKHGSRANANSKVGRFDNTHPGRGTKHFSTDRGSPPPCDFRLGPLSRHRHKYSPVPRPLLAVDPPGHRARHACSGCLLGRCPTPAAPRPCAFRPTQGQMASQVGYREGTRAFMGRLIPRWLRGKRIETRQMALCTGLENAEPAAATSGLLFSTSVSLN